MLPSSLKVFLMFLTFPLIQCSYMEIDKPLKIFNAQVNMCHINADVGVSLASPLPFCSLSAYSDDTHGHMHYCTILMRTVHMLTRTVRWPS